MLGSKSKTCSEFIKQLRFYPFLVTVQEHTLQHSHLHSLKTMLTHLHKVVSHHAPGREHHLDEHAIAIHVDEVLLVVTTVANHSEEKL